VRADLVVAHTGRSGGYRLSRPATEISLLQVIRASEHDRAVRTCILRGGPCDPAGRCDVHDVFSGARDAMLESLGKATLAEVAQARLRRLAPAPSVPSPGGPASAGSPPNGSAFAGSAPAGSEPAGSAPAPATP
jgi:DNA-binding IscR family transcriptional regulator